MKRGKIQVQIIDFELAFDVYKKFKIKVIERGTNMSAAMRQMVMQYLGEGK
jgi:hypothetical protein